MTELRELGQRRQEERQERLERQEQELEEQERERTADGQKSQPEKTAAVLGADEGISWGMGERGDDCDVARFPGRRVSWQRYINGIMLRD